MIPSVPLWKPRNPESWADRKLHPPQDSIVYTIKEIFNLGALLVGSSQNSGKRAGLKSGLADINVDRDRDSIIDVDADVGIHV